MKVLSLFLEVMSVGLWVVVFALPVVTIPSAIAAGVGHISRVLDDGHGSFAEFCRDFRRGVLGGAAVALALLVYLSCCALTLGLAGSDDSILGKLMVGAALFAMLAGVTAVCTGAMLSSGSSWSRVFPSVRRVLVDDPMSVVYVGLACVGAIGLTVMWVPLVVPSVGVLVFALAVIGRRMR
jgi:hypothetical protein